MAEVKRNDPCPCGSGKKHKKCCIGKTFKRKVSVLSSKGLTSTFTNCMKQQSSLSERKIKPVTPKERKFVMTDENFLETEKKRKLNEAEVEEMKKVPNAAEEAKVEGIEDDKPFFFNKVEGDFKATEKRFQDSEEK
ncbi:hypothetical protein AB751O23_AA_00040 [Chlamydiales bacterium SCGC AB-751-O23]|jgi:hypothetical protein|nr:hypothetical protein AB751O23_AA_00040 [Chlamydiales bacterium SCGC AB-751-O23]